MKKHTLLLSFFTFFLWQVTAQAQIITTVAGGGTNNPGDGGQAIDCELNSPTGVAVDASGNFYICERDAHRVRKVSTDGIITTFAGTGVAGYSGDGGMATAAMLNRPYHIVVDAIGNVLFSEGNNHCIRKVNSTGVISTIAGTGNSGFNGDGILATVAQLNSPSGIAIDNANNIYIADFDNNRVRKVNNFGIITTIVGTGATLYNGDNIPATNANLWAPAGVVIDNANNLFITDYRHHRIRKVNSSGIITTIAGNGSFGFSGDSYAATTAQLNGPIGICSDGIGNVFFSDVHNKRVRKINNDGVISTIAGNGLSGFAGDGGLATLARVASLGLAFDNVGSLLVCDYPISISRVRRISNLVSAHDITKENINTVMLLFPNPNNGNFIVNLSTIQKYTARVVITDIVGRIIHEIYVQTNEPLPITLDAPSGMYIITAITNDGLFTQKMNLLK